MDAMPYESGDTWDSSNTQNIALLVIYISQSTA
jgi:hypothetical protein